MTIRFLLLAAVLLSAVPVSAQDPATPPDSGAPAPTAQEPSTDTRQIVLDALGAVMTGPRWNGGLSIFGGYNQTNISQTSSGSSTLNSFLKSGTTAGVTTHLGTSFGRRKTSFAVSGGTATNYFRATDRFITSYHGQFSQAFKLGARSSFNAGQSIGVAPYYALNQFQGLQSFAGTQLSMPVQGGVATAIGDLRHYRYAVSADYSHPLTDRTTFSAQYSADATALTTATPIMLTQMASARIGRSFKKSMGIHAGYGYSLMDFRQIQRKEGFHNLDIGLDMNRGLSLTRRTKLTFGTGTVINQSVTPTPGAGTTTPTTPTSGTATTTTAAQKHLRFNLTGHVSLSHDFGRSWIARVNYGRTWQVVDGTYTPYLGNAINGGLSGRLSSGVMTGLNFSYMLRDQQTAQGTNQTLSRGDALASNVFLSVRVNNTIAGFVQYGYYKQAFDLSQVGLNLPSTFTRQSARAGLNIAFRSR